ncbi:retinol-binding protein pinta-like [Adelges cooleyi]|uniref:retinol-binding protein pinta-like n=1 Tax=Adelges cooleyi TaxID=133065 RepID=UPI0021802FDC|nr:retinol-binding protein pinta-like [Adelges cooleyi]
MEDIAKFYKITPQQEYERNPKLSENDVQELLKWANDNINVNGKLTDIQIIMFLHACNYDRENAKKVISQYFTLRAKKCAIYFRGRDPTHPFNQKQFDVVNINILEDEVERYSYIWTSLKIGDASQYYPNVAAKLTFMAIELKQVEKGTMPGYRILIDSRKFGLSHALRYSLSNAKNLMTYVQEATPFIIEQIYIINVTPGIERIYSTMKPFMSAALINKIVIKSVSKTEELLKSLPQHVVPKDFGGQAPTLQESMDKLRAEMIENREFFLAEERYRNGVVQSEVETITPDEEIQSFKSLSID